MIALAVFLLVCVFVFEFINGFHDTANAVATVIYTKSLKPIPAVIYSGLLNFLGVLIGGVWVAFSIVKLLPVVAVSGAGIHTSVLVVIAILLTAIMRNFFTWYKGLPCSSSHTLIGSIIGAVIWFCLLKVGDFSIVNRMKIKDVLLWLLISPFFGFGLALVLVLFFKKFLKGTTWFHTPVEEHHRPPRYIRGLLICTCGLVSYFHGSNDGQKWIGLSMVVLALVLPTMFSQALTDQVVPLRLILAVSVSLGLWTMIWWKRIVVTVWEKIWVDHLSYIQWAVAEAVAALAIGASTHYHLPVSTTHVLSSWVAWSMVASRWFENVQRHTVRRILLAWVLTLPVCLWVAAGIVYIGGMILHI